MPHQDQQVELLPGSGVYISMRAYVHLNKETWARGSKLVRRVVREVFPDEHILARSSCLGRRLGGCHVGLDHHKVDTIKGELTATETSGNELCFAMRYIILLFLLYYYILLYYSCCKLFCFRSSVRPATDAAGFPHGNCRGHQRVLQGHQSQA